MKNRAELDADLDNLAAHMPSMLVASVDIDQMSEFAAMARFIEANTGPEDWNHVWTRLQCILRSNGMVTRDGAPDCAT